MKNNNVKLLAGALIAAISIGSIGVSFANDSVSNSTGSLNKKIERLELTAEQKAEMDTIKAILDKKKAGETLTSEEQTKLDTFEANKPQRPEGDKMRGEGNHDKKGFGPMEELSDEEKTSLESMTDTEKKAFFDKKHSEQKAKMDSMDSVIDKLLAGEILTEAEEVIRAEIIKQRAERKIKMQEKVSK